jgi:hypothetical protein
LERVGLGGKFGSLSWAFFFCHMGRFGAILSTNFPRKQLTWIEFEIDQQKVIKCFGLFNILARLFEFYLHELYSGENGWKKSAKSTPDCQNTLAKSTSWSRRKNSIISPKSPITNKYKNSKNPFNWCPSVCQEFQYKCP